MTEINKQPPRRVLPARRLKLLGSVAVIGSALVLAGPLGYGRLATQAFAETQAPVTVNAQGPTGFADLVTKVKPAVISVRVRVDQRGDEADEPEPNNQELPPSMKGTPFERFFRQFDFPNSQSNRMQRHQMITGVGSGFFISADGYAVTNNHVVDHAKSVEVNR